MVSREGAVARSSSAVARSRSLNRSVNAPASVIPDHLKDRRGEPAVKVLRDVETSGGLVPPSPRRAKLGAESPTGSGDGSGSGAEAKVVLWLPKVLYFLNTCATVPWGRYKTIYFNSLGLSATHIGILRSGAHCTKLIAWPLWG
eukprot:Hpha_TRINITY_DN4730_c0_g1::TRINITY_DN4730_c0_g1_i1::g.130511::m.130511